MTLELFPRWLPLSEVASLWPVAMGVGLEQRDVTVWGGVHAMPRLTAWCCDDGGGYRYSGQETPAVPWPDAFLAVRARLEKELGREFPSCLVNLYRDGKDHVGWHRDDESFFGRDVLIASLSLGQTRRFKVRSDAEARDYTLDEGDLIVFTNEWEHTLPRTSRKIDARINLTFRTMGPR